MTLMILGSFQCMTHIDKVEYQIKVQESSVSDYKGKLDSSHYKNMLFIGSTEIDMI